MLLRENVKLKSSLISEVKYFGAQATFLPVAVNVPPDTRPVEEWL